MKFQSTQLLFWIIIPALLLSACAAAHPTPESEPSNVQTEKQAGVDPHPPVILCVEERTETLNGRMLLHKDIYFSDYEGDATSVVNKLLASNPAYRDITWADDPITVPAGQQKQTGLVTSTLRCPLTTYPITFTVEDRILDAAGNFSEPVTVRFACPANPPNSLPSLMVAAVFGLGLLIGFWLYFRRRPSERNPVLLSTSLLFFTLFKTQFALSVFHEGGHALAALIFGEKVWSIYVHPFMFAGYSRPFYDHAWIHAGGYITNLLISCVLFCLLWKRRSRANLPLVLLFPLGAITQGIQILLLNGDTANILRLTSLPPILLIVLGFVLVCSGLLLILALFPLLGLVPGDRKSLLVIPAAFFIHSMMSWLIAHWFVPGSTFDLQYIGVGVEIIQSSNLMLIVTPIFSGLFAVLYITLFGRFFHRLPAWLKTEPVDLAWQDLRAPAILAVLCIAIGLIIIL